ncbi:MAG: EAL domain-containing protein [Gallionella sp.]|jgi:diguanylate cyclase (GGDEF)-like protein/hemerythrin-like metal-binding protein/PAS domain S-box-containing protein
MTEAFSMKAIDIFPWNDHFNTGIAIIDEQHMKLAQLLNVLASHIAFNSDLPALNVIFDELADYADYHFTTEEAIWHEYMADDPLEAGQIEGHRSFTGNVIKLKSEEINLSENKVVEEVLAFLTRWLAAHILESDRYMAMVVLAMQSGMSAESAKLHAGEQMRGATRALIDIILAIYESLSANTLHLMRELAENHVNEEVLRTSEERLRLALGAANQGWFDLNVQTGEISVSPEYVCMIGYDPANFHSSFDEWKCALHPDDHDKLLQGFAECLQTGEPKTMEYRRRNGNGSWQWISSVGKVVTWDQNKQPLRMIGIHTDITARKLTEARIEKLAHFDHLTGLPNRIQMNDRFNYALNLAQRSGETLAVLFLDLDHFKNINDTLGHSIGDRLLMEMANRIKHALREEDTVSRLGGDEFILILPNADETGVTHVATKLLETIALPCTLDQHELITTASIGIAIFPTDGRDFETLMKNADAAMYRVKQDKRNAYRFFTQEMQAHSARVMKLSNAMRHALDRNEFQLHYQPQISIEDGHIVGAEALLRWQHPELGMISPVEFIPIAEDSGQIIQIGEWVLRTAITQLQEWMNDGLPAMVMAVNLSSVQFRQPNITQVITGILDGVQLPHQYLELELTEAMAMDDPNAAIEVMDRLNEQGIRMSIDDFGTGYSSLSYLKKFKVYKLKIDQSFVRDITVDPDDKAIVTAIINMASSLGIRTIAEGVETAGQLAFLRLQGCDEVQGYYFSKPLPASQFKQFVKNTMDAA